MIDYQALLGELAVPRLVGSPQHARVRGLLSRELAARACVVLEHPFQVQPPGRLAGACHAAGALAWVSLCIALGAAAPSSSVAARVADALLATALVLGLLALGRGGARTPVTGVNLIGVRPRARVAVWLAAHYDSKGQPISMAWRLGAVLLAGLGALGVIAVVAAHVVGAPWRPQADLVLAAPGVAGGVLFVLGNRVTNGSPGAVDNASALVTVLAILDRLPRYAPVGVLFLDAEEYGLLGAAALVRERANLLAGTTVLNFDGIDDGGPTRCVTHRAGPTLDAVATALGARRSRVLPVVVDGWALARATRECATIMRGSWRTAALVHTARDSASRLTLTGSGAVAAGVADALARALT